MVWEISCGAAYIDGFSWLHPQVSWSQPVQEEKSTGALQPLCLFLSVSNLFIYFSLLLLHFLCTLPLLFLCFFVVLSIGRFLAVFGHLFLAFCSHSVSALTLPFVLLWFAPLCAWFASLCSCFESPWCFSAFLVTFALQQTSITLWTCRRTGVKQQPRRSVRSTIRCNSCISLLVEPQKCFYINLSDCFKANMAAN